MLVILLWVFTGNEVEVLTFSFQAWLVLQQTYKDLSNWEVSEVKSLCRRHNTVIYWCFGHPGPEFPVTANQTQLGHVTLPVTATAHLNLSSPFHLECKFSELIPCLIQIIKMIDSVNSQKIADTFSIKSHLHLSVDMSL